MELGLGAPVAVTTFHDLLDSMPDKEFESTTRSTIALLAWWRDPARVGALVRTLGLTLSSTAVARFEYPVRAGCEGCGGRGKASFTDVMLDLGTDVVAIEAKRTERLYDTVSAWLGPAPTDNRRRVLDHWLKCTLKLDGPQDRYHDLVYQIVHRAASARHVAGDRRAHVVHLLFEDAHVDDYVSASRAAEALSAEGNPRFHVVTVQLERGPGHDRFVAAAHAQSGPDRVREHLATDDTIFVFGEPQPRHW